VLHRSASQAPEAKLWMNFEDPILQLGSHNLVDLSDLREDGMRLF
jgi:hypothetical protein